MTGRADITAFILKEVEDHPVDIVGHLVQRFGISRQTAHFHVSREIKKGTVIAFGKTRAKKYFLAGGRHIEFEMSLKDIKSEDEIWLRYIKPMVLQYAENIVRICNYGFTEILNNAMDHSGGTTVHISLQKKGDNLEFTILDNGIGIYEKIQKALNLNSPREAVLHLSKGKFTTDPSNHSGQGIFFTSRIFNEFSILSDDMYYTFADSEWLLSPEKNESFGKGTSITMSVYTGSKITPDDVMKTYSGTDTGFTKTIVAVSLSEDPGDPHVSRSQAKRLMMGLDKFRTVVLDFRGVQSVGQAFVDEVFRVFKNEHPYIDIRYIRANPDVDRMIRAGIATE